MHCLGHSQLPDVSSDQIQITCYASCLSPWGSENPTLLKMRLPSKFHQSCFDTLANQFKLFWMPFITSQNSRPVENDQLFLILLNYDHYHDIEYFFLDSIVWFRTEAISALLKFTSYRFVDMTRLRIMHVPPLKFWKWHCLGNHIIWFICSLNTHLPSSSPSVFMPLSNITKDFLWLFFRNRKRLSNIWNTILIISPLTVVNFSS